MSSAEFLDRYFDPVVAALTPQAARALLQLKPDAAATSRVAELGRKSNEGTLTDEEREEYRLYVEAGDLIAILKAKARRVMADASAE
jgi:hypothetical protein